METRASYVLIGLFTLAVIAGAFGFVFWFQNTAGTGERAIYRVEFGGPVPGLRTGSAVVFNGIRVGELTELKLDAADPRKVEARIAIDPKTPVRSDTAVSLEFQGLTGISSLALRGGAANAPPLPRVGNEPPTLTADPGATQDIIQTVRDTVRHVDSILTTNEPALRTAMQNLETFSAALARNSDRIDRVMAGVEDLIGSPEKPGELTLAARSFREAAKPIGELAEHLDTRTAELPEMMASIRTLAEKLDQRTAELPELITSVHKFTDNLDTRTVELPELVASMRRVADNVSKASEDFPEMVSSLKNFANTLDKRAGEIASSISRFANTGTRQVQALGSEGRRTLSTVDRAVKNFDRNPQRLIFGGSTNTVPEYNGR